MTGRPDASGKFRRQMLAVFARALDQSFRR